MRVSTLAPALFAAPALSTFLYATTQYGDPDASKVHTLQLTEKFGKYELKSVSSSADCGVAPSWLTATSDTVYCSDESTPGTLNVLTADDKGKLTVKNSIKTDGGDVHSSIFGDGKFMAIAHYGLGNVSTWALPITKDSKPLKTHHFEGKVPPSSPKQMNVSQPHQVAVEPYGRWMFSPDLSTDKVNIFKLDSGKGDFSFSTEIVMKDGSGPRHVDFYKKPNCDSTVYAYVLTELGNFIQGYTISTKGDLKIEPHPQGSFTTLSDSANKTAAAAAEVRVRDDTLTISNRLDKSFGKEDSLVSYKITPDGWLHTQGIYKGGDGPRTFVFNKKGDMAAIGSYGSNSTAIYKRDPKFGELGQLLANVSLGAPVSSVVWAVEE